MWNHYQEGERLGRIAGIKRCGGAESLERRGKVESGALLFGYEVLSPIRLVV
jgi:hypothetical protein